MDDIDIVIPWVDCNDPEWRHEYNKYKPNIVDEHSADVRFRDWELMRFWFRGIEKNMPWVSKIHFITCGHIPAWLNVEHPKLNIVKHSDYIPSEYLPTFSSHVIEIFIHRIKGLSEKFIYFNDDLFALNNMSEDFFFKKGLPCDTFSFNALGCENISHIIMNNIREINASFTKKYVLKMNLSKVLSLRYIDKAIRTMLLLPWPRITGFYDPHLPQAYLKKTFNEVWAEKNIILNLTANNKFRSNEDINQYLFRYWQLCKGNFNACNLYNHSSFYKVTDENVDEICEDIACGKKKIIVINDGEMDNYELIKNRIHNAFEMIFPNQCSYEI
ncbi:stealth family protein [Buttiauxella agrestis]|uniref:stealth family protein n=1 Tax=Buttiauxella agrestis TaxID=82977 RepID=UPI0015618A08|nr:stealth family protein [Buttiauxella agrestis]BCG08837.1 glycosyl transferase [Buttiauxella agrestis]